VAINNALPLDTTRAVTCF